MTPIYGPITELHKAEEQTTWVTTELQRMSAAFTALKREHEAALEEIAQLKAAGALTCSDREAAERLRAVENAA